MSSAFEIDGLSPRPLHYVLAHYTLRQEAFLGHHDLVGALRDRDQEYIRRQLLKTIINCHRSGTEYEPDSVSVEEIRVHSSEQDGITCHVISMPEARYLAEAFFLAVVEAPGVAVRYFTLEKGIDNRGNPRTVFCEWTADGTHLNFGDGPGSTVEAFAPRVFGHVKAELGDR